MTNVKLFVRCDAVVSLMSDVLINNLLSAPAFSNDLTSFSYIPSVFPSTSMSDPFQQLALNWERQSALVSLHCIPRHL